MTGTQLALLVGGIALVALVVAALATSRLQTLTRRVGSFDCALRVPPALARGDAPAWTSGVAQYGAESLYWWRLWSLSPRPARSWQRARLEVVDRRAANGSDRLDVPLVVRCRVVHDEGSGGQEPGTADDVELLMSPEAYAGLTSWLEASPPSARDVI